MATAPRARADSARTVNGFDHVIHARDVDVSGAPAIACDHCHRVVAGKLVGRPDHAACFGTCHGAPPPHGKLGQRFGLDADRARLCANCHAAAQLAAPFGGALAVPYPPYAIDPDFNTQFGHKQHAAVACGDCHDPTAAIAPNASARRAPHERCLGCHDGSARPGRGPAMTACSGCHPAATGKPQPPELAAVHDTVTSTFSHAAHARRSAAGKQCATCHAAIPSTDDFELPRPTAKSCAIAGCHDDHRAFGITVACVRCHASAPTAFRVARPTTRFGHGGPHAEAVAAGACDRCHPITSAGAVRVAGHAACTSCHADDFGARKPKTCGACHNSTEPWRALEPDRTPPEDTEFGATLDHGKHALPCARCHAITTPRHPLRPPRGHVACSGDACHARDRGPTPTLAQCAGCHREGLQAARDDARSRARWSVRATFPHPRHADVACTTCHVSLAGADLLAVGAPAKATCAPCHDGKRAFDVAGTQCSRCHAKPTAARVDRAPP